jgi:anti-sigma regulatory factor (Ser/Thr protein kinase)
MSIASPSQETGAGLCSEHAVLFYERDCELAATLADYLAEGLSGGAATIVIATPEHAAAALQRVRESGVDVAAALHEERLLLLDAADTLAELTVDGELDPSAFERVVGDLFRALAGKGLELCAYGEMVALLWDAGNCGGAIELETMWNGLAEDLSFRLLCAYSTTSLDRQDQRDALCGLHSSVLVAPRDELAHAIPPTEFECDLSSPARARRMVEAALEAEGHSESVLFGAALAVGELAGNAIRHACTGFTLTVLRSATALRVEVRDFAPLERPAAALRARLPHGLGLIDASAARWDHEASPDGKLLWAEFHTGP